jgi:trehalose 6-phosphate phosphatase
MGVPVLDAAAESSFLARVARASRRVLLLDYDGTLAPFRVDRSAATPLPGAVALLEAIAEAPRSRIVMLSGRRAREVRELLGETLALEIWGAHGVERLSPEGRLEISDTPGEAQRALTEARTTILARLTAELGVLPAPELEHRLELKPGGLAVHLRALTVSEAMAFDRAAREAAHGWKVLPPVRLVLFDGGLELRIPGPDKGDAVNAVLAEETGDPASIAVACLGDDATDEDAFRAAPTTALTLLVADTPRESAARFRIGSGPGVLRFLDRWNEALREAPRAGAG